MSKTRKRIDIGQMTDRLEGFAVDVIRLGGGPDKFCQLVDLATTARRPGGDA
jgi:hypothetical protein